MEKQIVESIAAFEKGKQIHDISQPPDFYQEVESYQGLDNSTYDITQMYSVYFPSLYRSSAFLTIYSYFEGILEDLCLLYQAEKGIKISLSDLYGRGINRSQIYLEKVANINISTWDKIKKLQYIRNHFSHRGLAICSKDKNYEKLSRINIDNIIIDTDQIIIKKGFLSYSLDEFQLHLKLLNESISGSLESNKG